MHISCSHVVSLIKACITLFARGLAAFCGWAAGEQRRPTALSDFIIFSRRQGSVFRNFQFVYYLLSTFAFLFFIFLFTWAISRFRILVAGLVASSSSSI
ncbi:hypothetical protein BJY01DRAFT_207457, partial [Aspergillus pseudoustus]